MILFTKDVFIKLKDIHGIHVNCSINQLIDPDGLYRKSETWGVRVDGTKSVFGEEVDSDIFIGAESKEEAYRIFRDIMVQVETSGDIPELQNRLMDKIITNEKEQS